MQSKTELLTPECAYHLYNRTNGSEKLFLSEENYRYFLQKYLEYISPVADTFCYCLMPNHFHFLIRIKQEEELVEYFNTAQNQSATHRGFKTLDGLARQASFSKLISQQFSHFFNGYTQAFNKQNNRKGSLFMHPFKRKRVNDTDYLKKLVQYIHYNPIDAQLCAKPQNWPYSSYPILLAESPTFLKREETIQWFEDEKNFRYFHSAARKFDESPLRSRLGFSV
jgi:putative transposase